MTTPPPAPAEDRGGAHRAPDPEPEPSTQATEPVSGTPPQPDASSAADRRSKLLVGYLAGCAALLAMLVVVVIYGVFMNDTETLAIPSGDNTTTTETAAAETTEERASGEPTGTATDAPSTPVEGGEATDGPLGFTVHGVEMGSTVVASNAPIEKNAQGQYAVVHMTVTNISDQHTAFVGTFQKLTAAGATYNIDDEATFYLDSGLAELPPGATADVSVVFDVPPGTVPEAIELHADRMSPGVEVPLP
jgi:hypothetical protein